MKIKNKINIHTYIHTYIMQHRWPGVITRWLVLAIVSKTTKACSTKLYIITRQQKWCTKLACNLEVLWCALIRTCIFQPHVLAPVNGIPGAWVYAHVQLVIVATASVHGRGSSQPWAAAGRNVLVGLVLWGVHVVGVERHVGGVSGRGVAGGVGGGLVVSIYTRLLYK